MKTVSRHCPMSPGRKKNHPPLRTTRLQDEIPHVWWIASKTQWSGHLCSSNRTRELSGCAPLCQSSYQLSLVVTIKNPRLKKKNCDLDTWRLIQLNDSSITLWFEFNLEAIYKAQPAICLLSGPGHICHTQTRPVIILYLKKKKRLLKPVFNLCLKIIFCKDEKRTFPFCFELAQ